MTRRSRFEREHAAVIVPRTAADLVDAGVTRYALRGPSWVQTSHGRFVPAEVAGSTTTQRIYECAAAVPSHATLTGWAALYVCGVDDLDGYDSAKQMMLPVRVIWGGPGGGGTGENLDVSRAPLTAKETVERFGLMLTRPLRATVDEMCAVSDLEEAVIVADAACHARVIDLDTLITNVDELERRRGIPRARAAARLADPGSRSPWETRLRVVYVVDAGLPKPEVNKPIFDVRNGRLVGMGDLLDPEAGHVLEFDGQHHRRRRQHNRDNVREEDFESLGLVVTRADSLDLMQQRTELVRRIRSGRARGLARDRSNDLWTVEEPDWWREEIGGADVVLSDDQKAAIYGDL